MFSGLRRPLVPVSRASSTVIRWLTYIQSVSVDRILVSSDNQLGIKNLPRKINCLDNKAQCRAHGGDIFSHDLLDDGCFPGVVQPTAFTLH